MTVDRLFEDAVEILKRLIAIPSFSREEKEAADLIEDYLLKMGFKPERRNNNNWVCSGTHDPAKPTILFNSHIDTVRPTSNWDSDPFTPVLEGDKLIGLGSNDAGASLVSLLAAFRYLSSKPQPYNIIYAATAEEEISGQNNAGSILELIGPISLAVVGEPTGMNMAVAEKGLLVIDGVVHGRAGHAARNEGLNAITEAMPVLEFFMEHKLERVSDFLGEVRMTVTGINAGTQHNVVPDKCTFMVDVRVNDCYRNEELFGIIQERVKAVKPNCELKARSFRLNSSSIPTDHSIVRRGKELGLTAFGSPTTSDQAMMPFNSVKIGPGDSARSHTANEYIMLSEIRKGIETYIALLDGLVL